MQSIGRRYGKRGRHRPGLCGLNVVFGWFGRRFWCGRVQDKGDKRGDCVIESSEHEAERAHYRVVDVCDVLLHLVSLKNMMTHVLGWEISRQKGDANDGVCRFVLSFVNAALIYSHSLSTPSIFLAELLLMYVCFYHFVSVLNGFILLCRLIKLLLFCCC